MSRARLFSFKVRMRRRRPPGPCCFANRMGPSVLGELRGRDFADFFDTLLNARDLWHACAAILQDVSAAWLQISGRRLVDEGRQRLVLQLLDVLIRHIASSGS